MRTLKKTLCLVLCLAMMVGLCAFGASATTFEDDADIKNKEAVDLLVGLGIINGYDKDNTFRPEKILTRAEAAKIIAYLLLGADAADALPLEDTQFTDVKAAHWASGYIGYCASMGVVEGIGNDKFDPSGTLTAAAWGKMLLCALGYDQYIEGMSGDSWDFNVTRLVTRTKLATGFAFAANTPMTRDNACLLAFNALTVPTVEYVDGVTVTTNDGTKVDVNARKQYGETLAELNYNLDVDWYEDQQEYQIRPFGDDAYVDGVITMNAANSPVADETELDNDDTYEIESAPELLGHYVRIYIDNAQAPVSLTEIGTTKTVAKAITTEKDLKKQLGKTEVALADEAEDAFCFEGGVAAVGVEIYDEDALKAPAGIYVFDDEGVLKAVIISEKEVWLDVVTAISDKEGEETITVGEEVLENNEDEDVVDAYEGIAVDDIVLVIKSGDKYQLVKPETVTGSISKVTSKAAVTLDGTVYAKSLTAGNEAIEDVINAKDLTADDMKDNTYTLYLDDEGKYIVCVVAEEEVEIPDVFYLYKTRNKDTLKNDQVYYSTFAVVIGADGAVSEKLLGSYTTTVARDNAELPALDALYTFKTQKDGTEKPTAFADNAAANVYAKNFDEPSGFTAKATKVDDSYVSSATKFLFIVDNAKTPYAPTVTVKEGPTATDLAAKAIYNLDKNGNKVLATLFVKGGFVDAAPEVSADTVYYVAPGTKWSTSDTTGYTYTVYSVATGKEVDIVTEDELDALNIGTFNLFTESKGITELDYNIDTDVFLGAKYIGRYESSIRLDADAVYNIDLDTTKAVIVDLRDGGTVSTVDALAKAAAKDNAMVLDVLMSKAGLTAGKPNGVILAIFIRDLEEA